MSANRLEPDVRQAAAVGPAVDLRSRRILIISDMPDAPEKERLAVWHHLRTLERSDAGHELVHYNVCHRDTPPDGDFDAVILHNSFLCNRWGSEFFQWRPRFQWIADMDTIRIAIPQDEGDHALLLDEWLLQLRVDAIFSVHFRPEGPLYPRMRHHARIYPCFPGYIDTETAERYASRLQPVTRRSCDLVYRARNLPYWFGSAGQLKSQIGDRVAQVAKRHGLRCDISTRPSDAVTGDGWFDLLASSRATIGTEGGSSVLDARGEVRAQISSMLAAEPELSFQEISNRMPSGWDSQSFRTITPRHFEAIITRTCQVLVRGEYRGVMEADRHYIPLEPDLSNIEEAVAKLKDDQLVEQMVQRAYEDIYLCGRYTYSGFAHAIEQAMDVGPDRQSNGAYMEQPATLTRTELDVLERELITERHEHALTQGKLQESLVREAELRNELVAIRRRLAPLFTIAKSLQNPLWMIVALLMAIGGLVFIAFLGARFAVWSG